MTVLSHVRVLCVGTLCVHVYVSWCLCVCECASLRAPHPPPRCPAHAVAQNKEKIAMFKIRLEELHRDKVRLHGAKEKTKKEVCAFGRVALSARACVPQCAPCLPAPSPKVNALEGSIAFTEREINFMSTQSAITDAGVNLEISKKKRRLNAELDSQIDRLTLKREELSTHDTKWVSVSLLCVCLCVCRVTSCVFSRIPSSLRQTTL